MTNSVFEPCDGLFEEQGKMRSAKPAFSFLRKGSFAVWFSTCLTFVNLAAIATFLSHQRESSSRSYETGFQTDLEIARSRLSIVEHRFEGGLQFNGNTFTYRNDTVDDQYVGSPTSDIDKAWGSLLKGYNIDLMNAELIHSTEKTYKWKDDNFFLSGLSVYHSLYCLNKIREALYPDYYQSSFTPEGPSRETYVEYCIDHLRQSLQCHSDLTPMNWERVEDRLILKSDTVHTCRDFTKLHDWASQRQTDYTSKTELEKEGVRIIPR